MVAGQRWDKIVYYPLKDLGTFCNTKHNVHRITKLTPFEDNDIRKRT